MIRYLVEWPSPRAGLEASHVEQDGGLRRARGYPDSPLSATLPSLPGTNVPVTGSEDPDGAELRERMRTAHSGGTVQDSHLLPRAYASSCRRQPTKTRAGTPSRIAGAPISGAEQAARGRGRAPRTA